MLYSCPSCGWLVELPGPKRRLQDLTCGDCGSELECAECEVELTEQGIAAVEGREAEAQR